MFAVLIRRTPQESARNAMPPRVVSSQKVGAGTAIRTRPCRRAGSGCARSVPEALLRVALILTSLFTARAAYMAIDGAVRGVLIAFIADVVPVRRGARVSEAAATPLVHASEREIFRRVGERD